MKENKDLHCERLHYERLHYRYIIGILIWTGLLVFAFFYGKDGNAIVSYIGFAGTLVSIVLAIAALIFAYYQNSVYGSANEKLDTSANKIERVTESLDRTPELISHQFRESIHELKNTIEHSLHSSLSDIYSALKEQSASLDIVKLTLYDQVYVQENRPNNEMINADDISLFVKKFVAFITFNQCLMLYYLVKIKEHNKIGDLRVLVDWLIENKFAFSFEDVKEGEDDSIKIAIIEQNMGIFWSMFFILTNANLFELRGNPIHTTVYLFNQNLEEEVRSKIDTSDRMNTELYQSFLVLIEKAMIIQNN